MEKLGNERKSIRFLFAVVFHHLLAILMPPSGSSTEGADRNADTVGPRGWHFCSVDACKHAEEGVVAPDVIVQLLEGNGGAKLPVEVGFIV